MEYSNDKLNEFLVNRLGVLELENLQLRAVVENLQRQISESQKEEVESEDGL